MTRQMRRVLRHWIPPIALDVYRSLFSTSIRFRGDFPTWEAARAASSGYDNEEILRRTRDAALKVARGEAIFERDSVLFDHVEFSFPALAALLGSACRREGQLRVLDFGGALGTSYRQLKAFHPRLRLLSWAVVEQRNFVECGRQLFQNQELRFFHTINEAVAEGTPDVVLLSSVLQYLEQPYALIAEICQLNSTVVVDATPCAASDGDRVTVQSVPPSIYEASYPCWVFSQDRLCQAFSPTHRMVASSCEAENPWPSSLGEFSLQAFIFEPRRSV